LSVDSVAVLLAGWDKASDGPRLWVEGETVIFPVCDKRLDETVVDVRAQEIEIFGLLLI